jgi:hypothetical protein
MLVCLNQIEPDLCRFEVMLLLLSIASFLHSLYMFVYSGVGADTVLVHLTYQVCLAKEFRGLGLPLLD